MRRRITALLLGAAMLVTTFAAGQQAAVAGPSKTDQHPFKATFQTGYGRGAGTDALVRLHVWGRGIPHEVDHYYWDLNTEGRAMERGTTWEYSLTSPIDMGVITKVCVQRLNNSGFGPDWHLRTVRIDRGHLYDPQEFIIMGWVPLAPRAQCEEKFLIPRS